MLTIFSLGRSIAIASTLTLSFALQPVMAQSTFDVSVQAGSCVNCHIAEERSSNVIPVIAGLPEELLLAQLLAFKSDTPPPNTTIMNRLVKGFSDDEIAALAKHFSQTSLTPKVNK